MQTGILLEKSIERPFAVSLANAQPPGLPEEIRLDDLKALREERDARWREFWAEDDLITREIEIRLAQAQAAGFDTKGW